MKKLFLAFALLFLFACNAFASCPASVAGCTTWYDVQAMSPSNGATVSTVTDQSGNGNTATATGSPTYATNAINSRAAINFTSGTSYLTLNSAITVGTGDFYIVAVARSAADTTIAGDSSTSAHQIRYNQSASYVLSAYDGTNNPQSSALSGSNTTFHVMEWYRVSGVLYFYFDGTAQSSGTLSASETFDQINKLQSSGIATMSLAEWFIYNGTVSSGNRSTISTFENNRYFSTPPPPATGNAMILGID